MKPFKFKHFSIHQDNCAMKVGTDGVLLGAWAQPGEAYSILDIGSGSGLIALQMAQTSLAEVIDAVEIEPNAYVQCVENFEQSDWADRLFCYHASLQEFVNEMQDEEYEFIISNPPFYTSTIKKNTIDSSRVNARHIESMSFEELIAATKRLLSKNGSCAFIIPFDEEQHFLNIASAFKLYPNRITRVRGTKNSKMKRSLVQLSRIADVPEISELTIEIERHMYTPEYIELVKDFYLKM